MAITVNDLTPEMLNDYALTYLKATDWMVYKSVEDSTYTVPAKVTEKRAFARTLVDTTAHKLKVDEITPIFYDVVDGLTAFKQLVVHKENQE